jgi:hypothetical protein
MTRRNMWALVVLIPLALPLMAQENLRSKCEGTPQSSFANSRAVGLANSADERAGKVLD